MSAPSDEKEVCKYCYTKGDLFRPCHCRAPVHRECLRNWCAVSEHSKCEVCQYEYHIRYGDRTDAFNAAVVVLMKYALWFVGALVVGSFFGYMRDHDDGAFWGGGLGIIALCLGNLLWLLVDEAGDLPPMDMHSVPRIYIFNYGPPRLRAPPHVVTSSSMPDIPEVSLPSGGSGGGGGGGKKDDVLVIIFCIIVALFALSYLVTAVCAARRTYAARRILTARIDDIRIRHRE